MSNIKIGDLVEECIDRDGMFIGSGPGLVKNIIDKNGETYYDIAHCFGRLSDMYKDDAARTIVHSKYIRANTKDARQKYHNER